MKTPKTSKKKAVPKKPNDSPDGIITIGYYVNPDGSAYMDFCSKGIPGLVAIALLEAAKRDVLKTVCP